MRNVTNDKDHQSSNKSYSQTSTAKLNGKILMKSKMKFRWFGWFRKQIPPRIATHGSLVATGLVDYETLEATESIRCQFYQHFIRAFFIQKLFALLFSSYSLALLFFGKNEKSAKAAHKMLMKLTTVQLQLTNFSNHQKEQISMKAMITKTIQLSLRTSQIF